MRKHKSVVAILLAVMMIFTFMPTMAFANDGLLEKAPEGWKLNGKWNDTFTSVKIGDTNYTQIARSWSDGVVTADVDYDKYNPAPERLESYDRGFYYDLANAEVAGATIWSRANFMKMNPTTDGTLTGAGLTTNLYVSLNDKINKTAFDAVPFINTNWAKYFTVTYKYTGFDAENLGEQKVTVTAVINPATEVEGETVSADTREMLAKCLVGEVPAKEITVQAATLDYNAAKFDFDEVKKDKAVAWGENMSMTYDGAAHTIVNSSVDGWTYTYALQDATTGKYNPGTVSVKDAGTYNVKVTATYKDSTKGPHNTYMTVRVYSANKFTFGFKNMAHESNNLTPVAAGADPYDYIAVNGICDADAEAAMAYFKEKYTIEVTKSASESSVYTWTIKSNKNYSETTAAKTYKSLFENYGNDADDSYRSDFGLRWGANEVSVQVVEKDVENTKLDDITFSGVTTKSFKAKKKTKKLAKAKTFQVAAVADSGNAITFSATSSNGKVSIDETGVVTVKKGLKKGAKVKLVVKAKTAAGNGYKAASAEKTYTIKIK